MEIEELDQALEDLEQRLERLRSLYEQYFLGLEKIEPAIARKDVDRRFYVLRRVKLRNTARRFRLQLLVQRYNTFQQYWLRICRQIENGTYTRHLIKAEAQFGKEALTFQSKRRSAAIAKAREAAGIPSASEGSGVPPANDVDLDRPTNPIPARLSPPQAAAPQRADDLPVPSSTHTHPTTRLPAIPPKAATAAASPRTPAEVSAPKPPPREPTAPASSGAASSGSTSGATGSGTDLSDRRIRELHAQLTAEKQRLADTAPVSLDSLSKSLHEAAAKLKSVHGDRSVDFRVVVKGGKAMVKPVLR
ncbi:MAG TPA: MXAN_5187 C-terminal domain-containing protein [Polyangiaceae bacterium]|nr:MXAN_5187 C-terminal domain-containing protein [Polyangiaceae bacterium]